MILVSRGAFSSVMAFESACVVRRQTCEILLVTIATGTGGAFVYENFSYFTTSGYRYYSPGQGACLMLEERATGAMDERRSTVSEEPKAE